jgi:hypothetical protein
MIDYSATLKAVQAAISDPMLARNHRGQLAAGLRVLERPDSMILACDYAEHVTWIYESILPGDDRVRAAVLVVRNFLKGVASIHEVAAARSKIWDHFSELSELLNSPIKHVNIVYEVEGVAVLTIRVCCQRQLEAAHYVVRDKWLVETDAVAYQASYVMALYAAGSDWDAKDKHVRSVARKRGYEASDKETLWQIQHLLDYLGEKIRSNEQPQADEHT